ncbi:MAG: alanine racemase [Candidatus Limnocylindrales bacterium]
MNVRSRASKVASRELARGSSRIGTWRSRSRSRLPTRREASRATPSTRSIGEAHRPAFHSCPSVESSVRTVCLVGLNAIRHNVSVLVGRAAPAALCAVVKADGYGHGMVLSVRAALSAGAACIGVVYVEEALVLRAAGVDAPVLALLVPSSADLVAAVAQEIDLGAGGPAVLTAVTHAAQAVGRPSRVHLEIDTGMGRGGSTASGWADLVVSASRARTRGLIEIVGIWPHLARAEEPGHPVTTAQLTAFQAGLDGAAHVGVEPELRHLANSAALLTEPTSPYNLVRAGIAVYGISPAAAVGSAQRNLSSRVRHAVMRCSVSRPPSAC